MRIDREGLSLLEARVDTTLKFVKWEEIMTRHNCSIRNALLAASMLASPAFAADVTPDPLLNPAPEPENWLMNHRTYAGQPLSPPAPINKHHANGLKPPYPAPP